MRPKKLKLTVAGITWKWVLGHVDLTIGPSRKG